MLQGRTYALLQVRMDGSLAAIPEISANKYMLWIRFMTQDRDLKPRSVDRDVPFDLALCAFWTLSLGPVARPATAPVRSRRTASIARSAPSAAS